MNESLTNKLARRISLRQLQVFESVARQLSFTRAAQELFLSQPTVSMQIKKLESDIGLPLTEQIGKKISLTYTGQALHEATRDILSTISRLEMLIDDQKGLHSGQLRIAVVSTANYFAPRLIGNFIQRYPGINVSLEVTNRKHILERMSNNQDDLYLIGHPPDSSELEFQPYLANPMVVIAPADHPLAKRKAIPLSVIAKEPFIIRESGSGTRIAMENRFNDAGQQLNVRMELGNNESIKQGVLGGLGLSVLSMHTLTSGDLHDLTTLDVQGFPISWQWYIGHPRGKQLSVLTKTFIDFMYKEGPSLVVFEADKA
ncbi:MAG: LysR substrate-binding domain-containing protein [Gammaproteobacteria bacterium]|nr:LysR substrate-binding domain-containing protein [Gammaproteobacteria bacterium]